MKDINCMAKVKWLCLVFAIAALGLLLWWMSAAGERNDVASTTDMDGEQTTVTAEAVMSADDIVDEANEQDNEALSGSDANQSDDEDEDEEDPIEKQVSIFDAEVDKWMDAEKTKSPSIKDETEFNAMFKALPADRKEECLQRALNLIPDKNVMLLVGILMDKSVDKELLELVYNDILNRDEAVKQPILKTIYKDKTHPCWSDTAWILDVTGESEKE